MWIPFIMIPVSGHRRAPATSSNEVLDSEYSITCIVPDIKGVVAQDVIQYLPILLQSLPVHRPQTMLQLFINTSRYPATHCELDV
jgi:hypothetical protein